MEDPRVCVPFVELRQDAVEVSTVHLLNKICAVKGSYECLE